MHYTYVLYSQAHDRYYIGSTGCLDDRVRQHNAGQTRSTKPFRPWVLVYQESFDTRTEARKRENQIKRFKRGRAFDALFK